MNVGLHARIAEGSDEDGVEVMRQHLESVGRNGGLVAEIAVGAPIEFGEIHGRPGGLNHIDGLWNHFFTDSVAGNNGDASSGYVFPVHFLVHGWNVNTIAIIEYKYGIYRTTGSGIRIGRGGSCRVSRGRDRGPVWRSAGGVRRIARRVRGVRPGISRENIANQRRPRALAERDGHQ